MKEKFFRSDSPYHIPKKSLKTWGITSNISMDELLTKQQNILNPLLTYWLVFHLPNDTMYCIIHLFIYLFIYLYL